MPSAKWSLRSRHSLFLAYISLSLVGLVMIYSASYYSAALQFGDEFYYVKKQAVALLAGVVLFVVGAHLRPNYIYKFRYVILVLSLILLAAVFIPGLGVDAYGATRWLNLGFMTIQPSEFSKFGLMLFIASELKEKPPYNLKNLLIPALATLAVCALIIFEPNMSITMTVVISAFLLMFAGGLKGKYIVSLIAVMAVAVPVMILAEPYRIQRLIAFVDPWANPKTEGYQLIQSYYALGNGGLFGTGLFNSRQKYLFLPFAESDFIFSIIGEELGFVGSAFILLIYFVIVFYGIKIAKNAPDRHSSLLAFGVVAVICVQTLLNVAVVSGTIPPTGVPLPLISAGGSSLMAFSFALGIVYGIDGNTRRISFHTM